MTGLPKSTRFRRRRQLLQGALAAALPGALVSACSSESKRKPLVVGGLPVTRDYLNALAQASDLSSLDLQSLHEAIYEFEQSGELLNASVEAALAAGTVDPLLADQVNRGMMGAERNWLNPAGAPGRPWYKHVLYACRQTYTHLELPGLTEAAESQNLATAGRQARILEAALVQNLNRELACAGGLVSRGVPLCPSH